MGPLSGASLAAFYAFVALPDASLAAFYAFVAQKRRIPEDPLAGRIFLGPFFIRILTTFAILASPNALIPTV